MLRSVEIAGGLMTNVTSVCHWLALLSALSTASTAALPSAAGTVGCAAVRSPK